MTDEDKLRHLKSHLYQAMALITELCPDVIQVERDNREWKPVEQTEEVWFWPKEARDAYLAKQAAANSNGEDD